MSCQAPALNTCTSVREQSCSLASRAARSSAPWALWEKSVVPTMVFRRNMSFLRDDEV